MPVKNTQLCPFVQMQSYSRLKITITEENKEIETANIKVLN